MELIINTLVLAVAFWLWIAPKEVGIWIARVQKGRRDWTRENLTEDEEAAKLKKNLQDAYDDLVFEPLSL